MTKFKQKVPRGDIGDRKSDLHIAPGFDGEYGKIKIFAKR